MIFLELFKENMTREQVRQFPTLTLAHIGDAVYELLARGRVVREGMFRVHDAHLHTIALVSAEAQYRGAQAILDGLRCV